jgi:hypothetical protein
MSELLRPLVEGEGAPTLTVDFGGGRPEAEFGDLFRDLPAAGPVVELVPLPLVHGNGAPARSDAYVDAYAEALAGQQRPACAMGYCVAAALTHELAVRLAAEERAPGLLVLFDAAPVSSAEVVAAYEKIARGAGNTATVEALAREIGETGESELLEVVRAELTAQLEEEFEAAGFEPDTPLGEELIGRQVGWFSYVVAASSAPLTHYDGEVALVCSTKQVTPPEWPARTVRRYDVEVSQPELLAAEEVRNLVAGLLQEAVR